MSHSIYTEPPIFIVRWRAPETRDVDAVYREFCRYESRLEEPVIYVSLIDDHSTDPPDEFRKAAMEAMEKLTSTTRACYLVLAQTGFKAAVTRAIIGGMALLPGRRPPFTFVSSIHEVVERERSHLPESPSVMLQRLGSKGVFDAPSE